MAIETVSLLGDTRKEQWLNAVELYALTIESNLAEIRAKAVEMGDEWFGEDEDAPSEIERMAANASSALSDFKAELRRLVNSIAD